MRKNYPLTLGFSVFSSSSFSSQSQPFFLRGPHSWSTMMPVSPNCPGLQDVIIMSRHLCHDSCYLLLPPFTTPMHFFHLKQERPQLPGRLASVRPITIHRRDNMDSLIMRGRWDNKWLCNILEQKVTSHLSSASNTIDGKVRYWLLNLLFVVYSMGVGYRKPTDI